MRGALRHRTAPQASRRQPVPAIHRLTPGLPLRGRRPMTNPFQTVSYRTYAVHIQTDRLLSITAYFACGSMVRDLSCSRNVGSKSQHFVNKIWVLPPCRRRNWLSGQRPRNACNLQELRGGRSNQTHTLTTAVFACGNMVLFFLFTKHPHPVQILCEQGWNLPPCRRRIFLYKKNR